MLQLSTHPRRATGTHRNVALFNLMSASTVWPSRIHQHVRARTPEGSEPNPTPLLPSGGPHVPESVTSVARDVRPMNRCVAEMWSGRPQLFRPDAMFEAARRSAAWAEDRGTPLGVEDARNHHRIGPIHLLELRLYARSLHGGSGRTAPPAPAGAATTTAASRTTRNAIERPVFCG